jgi:hypothetical protein
MQKPTQKKLKEWQMKMVESWNRYINTERGKQDAQAEVIANFIQHIQASEV